MRAPEQSAGNLVSLRYSLACEHYSILQAGRVCRLYVWGDVRYRDAFDENRQSRFCYSFDAPTAKEPIFEACPTENCEGMNARLRPLQVSDVNDCKGGL